MGLLFLATHLFFIVFVTFDHFWTTIPLNLKFKKNEKRSQWEEIEFEIEKKNKREKREKGREEPERETAVVVAAVAETTVPKPLCRRTSRSRAIVVIAAPFVGAPRVSLFSQQPLLLRTSALFRSASFYRIFMFSKFTSFS